MIDRHTFKVGTLQTTVAQAGAVDRPEAAVFLHGNPGAIADWAPFLEPIGDIGRAVAFDLPGYGSADKPDDFDYTVAGYAAFISGALHELGISKAHIVAHDFGGIWAMRWAADHPECFSSATLINTGVLIDYEWHDAAKLWRTPEVGESVQDGMTKELFAAFVSEQNPRLGADALDALWEQAKDPGTKQAVLRLYRATPEAMLAEPETTLRELDRPALVIWGENDAYLPVSQAEKQRQSFPSAEVTVLPGAGHWIMLEDPDALLELMLPFLRQQLSGSR